MAKKDSASADDYFPKRKSSRIPPSATFASPMNMPHLRASKAVTDTNMKSKSLSWENNDSSSQQRRTSGSMTNHKEQQQQRRRTQFAKTTPVTYSQDKPPDADLLASYDPTGLLEFASGRSAEDAVDLDEVKYSELLTLDKGLYRALSGGVDDDEPTPPPDAFTVSGFDSKKPKKQRITNRRETFSLHVKIIRGVHLDIEHLIDKKKDMPKAAKRYVKTAQLEATAVSAVTNDDIEFVGILFSSENKSRQLLWAVDYGLYASTMNEPLTRRQLRPLSSYPLGAPLPECFAPTIPDSACLDEAESTYTTKVHDAQDQERAVLAEIQLVLNALEVARLNAFAAAAALCGSPSDEISEQEAQLSFDPDKTYQCLDKDEAPPIIRSYVYYYSLFKNRLRDLRLATTLKIDALSVERKHNRVQCCIQPPTLSPNLLPSSFPTASPTLAPTKRPSIMSSNSSEQEDDAPCGAKNGRRVTVTFEKTADGASLKSGDVVNLDVVFPGGARFGVSAATTTSAPQEDSSPSLQNGMIWDTEADSDSEGKQGNVLMISNSQVETNSEGGGIIYAFFDEPVGVESMTVLDVEMDGSYVLLKDAAGTVLEDVPIPVGQTKLMFVSDGLVTNVEIVLLESGGIDDLAFFVSCNNKGQR